VVIAGDQLFWHGALLLLAPQRDMDKTSYDRLTITATNNAPRRALA
jgi:hypothetical protein